MSLKKLIDLDLLDRFLDKVKALIPAGSYSKPVMDGTAALGNSQRYAREDHVHPRDTLLFSLGLTGTTITRGMNLNSCTTSANYCCTTDSVAESLLNSPTSKAFKMVVIKTGTQDGFQLLIDSSVTPSNSSIYCRHFHSTVWSDWFDLRNPSTINGHTVQSDIPANAFLLNLLAKSSRTDLPYNADLNDYTSAGVYSVNQSYTMEGVAIENSPLPRDYYGFTLFVFENNESSGNANDPDGSYQLLFPSDYYSEDAGMYIRRRLEDGWTDWINLASPTTVNGHTVLSDVPANAVFTDTTYESKTAASGGTDVSLVTTGEKATWNAKGTYSKPSGGIPDSDIASAATWNAKGTYSKPSGGIPDSDIASAATWNAKGTYSKPSGGIPDSDIASAATWNAHAVTNKGSAFASGLYKITTNSEGHVTGATAVAKSDITALGIPESDTTYTPASSAPLMDGTAAVGTSTKYAREDHVHPRDEKVFSLVKPTNIIPESADLDEYYTAGTYLCPSAAIASTLLHAPENDDAFVLVVMRLFEDAPRMYQFAFINAMHPGVSSATIYFRYHSTVWSDWFDIRNPSSVNGHSVLSDVPANLAFNGLYYGECDTRASTAAKVVTLTNGDGFSLVEGAKICIRFVNANSASSPTLNVNDTGAKPVVRFGTTVIGTSAGGTGCWSAGGIVLFVYDGTSWVEHYWNNTTYSSMSVSEYTAGTATTGRIITAARLKAAIKLHSAPDVYTATIPTTGWTTASYGAYIDVTFTGATFAADDTVFVDLNLSSDTNLQLINDSWACLLRATPTASSAVIRFKFREVPTVAIPVRAVVK